LDIFSPLIHSNSFIDCRFIAKNRFPDILEVCCLEPLNARLFHRHCGSQKFIFKHVQDLLKLDMDKVRTRDHFREAAQNFFRWVESVANDGMIILLAHNGNKFDHKILRHHLGEAGILIPPNWYFADTLPLIKTLLPGLRSYSLKNLAMGVLGKDPAGLHQASTDVTVLWTILQKLLKEENEEKALTILARHLLHTIFGEDFELPDDLDENDFEVV